MQELIDKLWLPIKTLERLGYVGYEMIEGPSKSSFSKKELEAAGICVKRDGGVRRYYARLEDSHLMDCFVESFLSGHGVQEQLLLGEKVYAYFYSEYVPREFVGALARKGLAISAGKVFING